MHMIHHRRMLKQICQVVTGFWRSERFRAMVFRRYRPSRIAWITIPVIVIIILAATMNFLFKSSIQAASAPLDRPLCDTRAAICTETNKSENSQGEYTGHDEPSLLFYSNKAGSGNSSLSLLKLPKEPPKLPKQDGTGGTFNFQLHPAFWYGMAMCDTQSAPNPGTVKQCIADSDGNIFDNPNKTAPDYIGNHPGAAFMEMQFYPPAWAPWPAGLSCDPTKWCAALTIDSFSFNQVTGTVNNADCLNKAGEEYVNFAFITRNGKAQAPASPLLATQTTFIPDPKQDLFMSGGDTLSVDMHDTPAGFQVIITDLTTRQSGSMVASVANGFGQVKFDPTATTCQNIPAAFHPMYATSSEKTRVPWAAHSYNVAFSDEIGHFEYCDATDGNGNCTNAGVNDASGVDEDDIGCFDAGQSLRVKITGCIFQDLDFDGVPYQKDWPGTDPNALRDRQDHAQPILFTSPLFNHSQNYDRVAFETDLPAIESSSPLQSCSSVTGAGCTNPPVGANFYPIYTTRASPGACIWQLGGPFLPGTTNTFGGTSTTEYGSEFQIIYPSNTASGNSTRVEDDRQILPDNPCRTGRFDEASRATQAIGDN
jgi:hypothetical protein